MRARRLVTVGMVLVAFGFVLAGCSSSSGKKTSSTGSTSGGATTIQLTAKDFAFTPTTIAAKAGQKVTVTFKNDGSTEHNFSISSLNVDKDAEKGASASVSFTPTQSGTIEFFCKYHKVSNNMVGSLQVT
jgi:plastocyanin